MSDNLPSSSSLKQDENRSSTETNFSDQNKLILLSLIIEINNTTRIFKSDKDEDKQKVEAISTALQTIDKLERFKFEHMSNIDKNNAAIKELEAKKERINMKNIDLKTKMEKSNQDYTNNVNKKNDEINMLKQKIENNNKELVDLKFKKNEEINILKQKIQAITKESTDPKSNQSPIISSAYFLANKSVYVSSDIKNDEDLKNKYDSSNIEMKEKDKLINEKDDLLKKKSELLKVKDEEIAKLKTEIEGLKEENRHKLNEIKSLKRRLKESSCSKLEEETS